MVEPNVIMNDESMPFDSNPKKRSYEEFLKPQLIMHRFKSKNDFITYFSESRMLLDAFCLTFL